MHFTRRVRMLSCALVTAARARVPVPAAADHRRAVVQHVDVAVVAAEGLHAALVAARRRTTRAPATRCSISLKVGDRGDAAIALVLGTLASLAVQRYRFFGRETLSLLIVLPIALPGIVTGIALNAGLPPGRASSSGCSR